MCAMMLNVYAVVPVICFLVQLMLESQTGKHHIILFLIDFSCPLKHSILTRVVTFVPRFELLILVSFLLYEIQQTVESGVYLDLDRTSREQMSRLGYNLPTERYVTFMSPQDIGPPDNPLESDSRLKHQTSINGNGGSNLLRGWYTCHQTAYLP